MAKITVPPTADQFKLITFIEEHWYANRMFPSVTMVSKGTGFAVGTVREFLDNETVKIMLENRGVTIEDVDTSTLSREQIVAANTYLNLADPRPLSVKLKELGINPTRFNGWLRGKAFNKYIQERAEELFSDGMPFAHRELMNKVMQGDLKAIRLFYEISGRHTGVQSNELQNVAVIVQRLLEAIQLEIGDPALIERVGKRFNSIMAGESIGAERVIPQNAIPVQKIGTEEHRKLTVVKEPPEDTV